MNIYFALSITGGRDFESVYQAVVQALVREGHHVPTAHLAESGITSLEAVIDPREVYERDVAWIRACDVLIAEVSIPSHGVGYEIGFALELGKPVLALYQNGCRVSKMISGNPDPNLTVQMYQSTADAIQKAEGFLSHRE
jgi:2'-deoxynucleoside 5'-phosphate N-hydrolase